MHLEGVLQRSSKESDLEWQRVSGKLFLCTMFASLGQTVPKQLGQCQKMGLSVSPNVRCKVEDQTDSEGMCQRQN